MPKNKKSFFERLAGNSSIDEEEEMEDNDEKETKAIKEPSWLEDEESGQLTIDMFQTPTEIVIEAMIAGVKPEDIDVSVNKDMLTINGKRQKSKETSEENYYYKELYWGSFSRSIMLPQEVDTDNVDATIKNGVLKIRLPKIDKEKTQKIKIKN
ncbi:MAG: hypothetical protein COT67_00185, partial [Candidatus Tagabacteria bacterium CG09_land_8_20_14_0_10_41_14]